MLYEMHVLYISDNTELYPQFSGNFEISNHGLFELPYLKCWWWCSSEFLLKLI